MQSIAGSQFYQRNNGTTIGTLYTTFYIDNDRGPYGSSAYRAYLDLDVDGTWRPSRHIPNSNIAPCACAGYSNWDSASQTLHLDQVLISGFDYSAVLEIKIDQTWRLISLTEKSFDLNGRWVGSYQGRQISYAVTHSGNYVDITSDLGSRISGTIEGKTALLTQSSNLITSTSRAVLTSKNSVTMTVLSCTVPSGYVCIPGAGKSVTITRN